MRYHKRLSAINELRKPHHHHVRSPESEPEPEKILTVENNTDLATLLAGSDFDTSLAEGFLAKYEGRTIEFDGNIAYMRHHGNYKTRYDLLIYVGNYNQSSQVGPSFKFDDVKIVTDLHLTGSNVPDSIGEGQELRIIAEVESYSKGSLIILEPVSTQIR